MKKNIRKIFFIIIILTVIISTIIMHMYNKETKRNMSINAMVNNETLIQKTLGQRLMNEEIMQELYTQYDFNENGNIIINEYNGKEECVIIPEEIDGKKIEEVNPKAFVMVNETLEMIKMPKEIAEKSGEIEGFEISENLTDENYIVYITTREYNESYIEYLLSAGQENLKMNAIPKKFIAEEIKPFSAGSVTIPSRYDLRNDIAMTVDNQQNLGLCYAYSTTKSMETYIALKEKKQVNFSEIHLAVKSREAAGALFHNVYNNYFALAYGPVIEKPNTLLSQSYLMSQRNSNETAKSIYNICAATEDTYINDVALANSLDYLNTNQEYYVMGYKVFNTYNGEKKKDSQYQTLIQENRNEIKKSIMANGSVIAYIATPKENVDYMDYGNIAVMCHLNRYKNNGAHNVSIIGWDDNFSESNFPASWGVTKKGAWLALNSWGSTWGNNDGTFWISYEDYDVETDNTAITNISKGKVNINNADIKLAINSVEYNGIESRPEITCTYAGMNNSKGIDYNLTYIDNINAGTASVIIDGVGRFSGQRSLTYQITPRSLEKETVTVTLEKDIYNYTGKEIKTNVVVKDNDKVLEIGKDYTITYVNNINVGTATVMVKGIKNYAGKVELQFYIEKGTPIYSVPSGLVAVYGDKLKDIKLPKGFTWEDNDETYVGEVGNNIFKCTYKPEDIVNNKIVTGIEVTLKVIEKLNINIQKYSIETSDDGKIKYIDNIKDNTCINEIKEKINTNGNIIVYESDGTKVFDDKEIVKTGMKIGFETEKEYIEYTLIVIGDNNGDGKCNSIDLLKLARFLVGLDNDLYGAYLESCDIYMDGKINQVDLLKLARVMCGLESLD